MDLRLVPFKHFVSYHHYGTGDDKVSGGVSIIVNRNVAQSEITLSSPLQVIAVRVTLHVPITICSIYLPPSLSLNLRELDDLVAQLPSPYILLGDFNGHHSFWGSSDDNTRGKLIADFIYDNDLRIFNDESPTYFCSKNQTFSHLDLTISSPSLFQDFSWSVHDDLCHSDHYPVILRNDGPSPVDRPQRWKLSKANWPLFEALCISSFSQDDLDVAEDPMEIFTTILQDISGQAIRKTSTAPKRFNKPWFNEDCKTALKERNRALRLIERSPTADNMASFRIARAKARRTIRQAKRSSWQEYVSRINSRTSSKSVWDRIRRIKDLG
ncbi:hypothetical protein LOTGIDRAFT_175659 [Lottia gigantea]|uniref:Endonuclease/exonuclease/phosphatase domain-containing protein n=1 Tax=Lottia gigantea TaxID=225164 RepID=V4A7G9_LOTGI|nr:hypothetical protein LOTGIDRAFT_175659 [Lottia gigantea]ESO92697.1 hypothetical protein LOTGIDRAFT_175659 [Lottia gigantea]